MKSVLVAAAVALLLPVAPALAQNVGCPLYAHSAKVISQTTAYTIGGTDVCRALVFTGSGVPGANLPYPTTLTGYNFWVRIFNNSGGSMNITPLAGATTAAPTINGS